MLNVLLDATIFSFKSNNTTDEPSHRIISDLELFLKLRGELPGNFWESLKNNIEKFCPKLNNIDNINNIVDYLDINLKNTLEMAVGQTLREHFKDKLTKMKKLVKNSNYIDFFNSAPISYRCAKILGIIRKLSRYIAHFKKSRLECLTTTTLWVKYWENLEWIHFSTKCVKWNLKYNMVVNLEHFERYFNRVKSVNIRDSLVLLKTNFSKLYKIETSKLEKQKITAYVNARNMDLKRNPKKFLNSILNRSKQKIVLNKVIIEN